MKLEDIKPGLRVRGIVSDGSVLVQACIPIGSDAVQVIYRDIHGALGERVLYRDDEPSLDKEDQTNTWQFDGDGTLLRLVSEAYRIRLAWLFDPYLAISSSNVEPLPHQLSAVYEEMLPRQPLRYLLADDPGAGKTIMAGLLMKELQVRGDLRRCLIIAPGSLVDQWQDELAEKFGIEFEIFSRSMVELSRSGNPFGNVDLMICRMDQLSRSDDLQQRFLTAPEWDLIVCDEAHRMSATRKGQKTEYTKRFRLGQKLSGHCRNFLLLTATPHNGHDEDFRLFLSLLDQDRFEGASEQQIDASGVMRRLVKEDLYRFDGKPLFPERVSRTVQYALSESERILYEQVTSYVRDEMNRAERLLNAEGGQRRNNVGFALMTLQRRLASSPEAIFRSVLRRRERLVRRIKETLSELRQEDSSRLPSVLDGIDDIENIDFDVVYEEADQNAREAHEQKLMDYATAAQTVEELEKEIERLNELEQLAKDVVQSGEDAKWRQLQTILDDPLMTDADGRRRKLVIFTEFRDTLSYLAKRIRMKLGNEDAVVEIHGGVSRENRRRVVRRFMSDPNVVILVANDAAGEGVNLQRAHLMVNYDLPWNPNRLEQRFGRIHRIGQREVCHLWNLIAKDTREGEVYLRLLTKLEREAEALNGKVYDVLGQLFEERSLRHLLMEAVQYGDRSDVRAKLDQEVDGVVDRLKLQELLDRQALVSDVLDVSRIQSLRRDIEHSQARRLQPHFLEAFFVEAFRLLGGKMHRCEGARYEITRVPHEILEADRRSLFGPRVLSTYERVCFDKGEAEGSAPAELIAPGSPLLQATISVLLEKEGDVLRRGAVLVDEADDSVKPRLLFYLEHEVRDGTRDVNGKSRSISRQLHFTEVDEAGGYVDAGIAPYLKLRSATHDELEACADSLKPAWLSVSWELEAISHATAGMARSHLNEVAQQRLPRIKATRRHVEERLSREVARLERKAAELRAMELAGRNTRLPAQNVEARAKEITARMKSRLAELDREQHLTSSTPVVHAAALILPRGLVETRIKGWSSPVRDEDTAPCVEACAELVMRAEQERGYEAMRVDKKNFGYHIHSHTDEDIRLIVIKTFHVRNRRVWIDAIESRIAQNEPNKLKLALVGSDMGLELVDAERFISLAFDKPGQWYNVEDLIRTSETIA